MKTQGNDPITAIKDVGFDVDTESISFDASKADFRVSFGGLTKREHFASLAMQGVLSNHMMVDTINVEWVAQYAVNQADALIDALNKEATHE